MIVALSYADFLYVGNVAVLRATSNLFKGRRHKYGERGGYFVRHVEGALAEYAAAKALGLFWPPPLDDFGARDVGGLVDVRATEHARGCLILHPEDADDAPFVLAHIDDLPRVRLSGWLLGREAKKPQWWSDPSGKNRHAYFVPQTALRDMAELSGWVSSQSRAA